MNWGLLKNSLLVGGFTAAIAVSFGFISALWLAGLPARCRTGFFAVAIIALALPPFLVTNCWLHFLGHTGTWHAWLPVNIFSLGGTVWILSLVLWPLSLLLISGAWQRLEPSQLESDMMVSGWWFMRALLFPLARTALAQAAMLIFVLALNNFAVPAILQVKVFPAEMWVRFNTTFDTLGSLQLCWPLVIGPLFLLLWLSRRELPWPNLDAPVSARLFRQQLGRVWFWASGICTLVLGVCTVVLPLVQILSVRRTWTELPGALAAGQGTVWNSFWYAGAGATAIILVSLLIVAGSEIRSPKAQTRKKAKDRNPKLASRDEALVEPSALMELGFSRPSAFGFRIAYSVGWLAFLLPGVLLGIGLIHAFNHQWSAVLYQSAGIVILAFVIRYLVIGWNTITQAARKVDSDLKEVALLEGATRWQMLRYVHWPQIAPQVGATWYIVFLLCLWDVESMILVVPPGGETLALRIFNLLHYGHNAQVNALCLILLVVAVLPLLVWKLSRGIAGSWSAIRRVGPLILLSCFPFLLSACRPPQSQYALRSSIFASVQIVGTRGAGVGQLNKPRSVAIDDQDNLYVVDMTGRVQKFSSNGVFLLSWQMPQTELGKPKGMCRDRHGNILVLEPHYSRVNVFSPMGRLLAQWGSHGTNAGQLSLPRAVAVNSHGETFVSEYQESERVQKFSFDPARSEAAISGPAPEPSSLILPPSPFIPPRWAGSFGQAGTGPGEFNRPEGLCVDAQDQLYVADSCNHRIQVFSSDGRFLRAYGKPGKGPGELSYPYDICVDRAGRQYVCEFGNSRIQVFDAQDRPLEIIGSPGAAPGLVSNPWGVALDSADDLYVADSQNHRVQKLVRRP
jgi:ABC-type Fe3+ transport system permease subunit/DNA-binding beta-propeller fold protein YncE